MKPLIIATVAWIGSACLALADPMQMDMDPSKTAQSPEAASSTMAFEKANQKMHENMMMSFTGDADIDFVRGMIPHHQGAIEMAKVQLQYGKDPEIRKLAEDIIRSQEAEIAAMNAWLAKHQSQPESQAQPALIP